MASKRTKPTSGKVKTREDKEKEEMGNFPKDKTFTFNRAHQWMAKLALLA